MGLFDLFRSAKTARPTMPGTRPKNQRFSIDRARMFSLDQTRRLAALFQTPRDRRDPAWTEAFYDAAWYASISQPDPVHFSGPDGFSYYRLNLPRANSPFDSQSLGNVARQCCERYVGAAFFANPDDPETAPEFVLSMGLLDSLLRYDSPDGDPIDRNESRQSHERATFDVEGAGMRHEVLTVAASHSVLVGSPSPEFLPAYTARGLHRYMSHIWGIEDPRICLLVDHAMKPSRNLVIGRKRSSFASDEEMSSEMVRLSWFLPPCRSMVAMPEDWTFDKMDRLADLCG